VADENGKPQNRVERRKQRTRSALITAAQEFIAAGKLNAPVLDITQAADVGMGSYYNNFDSKEQLFQVAVNEVLDRHGALLDNLTQSLQDPAETFACSFRLTGRFVQRHPQEASVLLNSGLGPILSDRGLAPRALRDITAANKAGRFRVADPELAVVMAGGTMLGLVKLLHDRPERDAAETTDQLTVELLRAFGVPEEEAHEICRRPLPNLEDSTQPGPAV
jgi:AcrR family transcriptional regulator